MKILLLFTAIIALSSCAPMPGNNLMHGVREPTSIENVDVRLHKANILSTSAKCLSMLWAEKQYGMTMLAILANSGIIPACAKPWISVETGKVVECDIYYSADMFLKHELRHCMGYADVLY